MVSGLIVARISSIRSLFTSIGNHLARLATTYCAIAPVSGYSSHDFSEPHSPTLSHVAFPSLFFVRPQAAYFPKDNHEPMLECDPYVERPAPSFAQRHGKRIASKLNGSWSCTERENSSDREGWPISRNQNWAGWGIKSAMALQSLYAVSVTSGEALHEGNSSIRGLNKEGIETGEVGIDEMRIVKTTTTTTEVTFSTG
ncbi:hypothetical protein BS50DRAFT_579410 [Corynespora cassiicola Philippines]|uniref:Uncharacterized protein n=1 Tax=Corynespora cassiicola Philippines TaxID=1448308 RepID=A0A2T2N480_CORCC|nr:hypothetical protein BS50DRAFT_579410 [Corynespora cassiicola Philippines]